MTTLNNKQLFVITNSVFASLTKLKLLSKQSAELKQVIYDAVKTASIKIELQNTDAPKTPNDKHDDKGGDKGSNAGSNAGEFEQARQLAEDPVYARGWLIQQLALNTASGNAAAAKEIRDLLSIGKAEDEQPIEIIDYRNLCVDCPLGRAPDDNGAEHDDR